MRKMRDRQDAGACFLGIFLLLLTLPMAACASGRGIVSGSAGSAGSAKGAEPAALNPDQVNFCRILYGCNLTVPPGFCPAPGRIGPSPYTFDDTRCSEA